MKRNQVIFLFIIITAFFGSIIIIFLNNNMKHSEELVEEIVEKEAKAYFNSIVSRRHWSLDYEEIYIKENKDLKENEFIKENKVKTNDGQVFVMVNPNWMDRNLYEKTNKRNKNYAKITSLNPLNPKNKPDKFETEALKYLEKNKDKKYYSKISDDRTSYNLMGALSVNKTCLKCHGKQGYKIGDIKGGIRISIPTDEYFKELNSIKKEYNYLLMIIIIGGTIVLSLFIWFVNRFYANKELIEKNYKKISSLKKVNDDLITRFTYAIDGTKDGIWDWNLKTNEIFFSKNWKRMLGYKEDEIENDLKEWEKRVHPDDKQQALIDILNNQNKVTSYYQNIHRMKHKDDSWVWILDRGKTYFNEMGEPVRMVGFHSDISELKNLQLKLKETEHELNQLKVVIENAPIGIVITNLKGEFSYVNPRYSELTGYKKNELLGKNINILKYDNEKESEKKYKELWLTVQKKKTWGGIFRNRKKDGSEYWETLTVLPILDSKEEVTNFLGIIREITKEVYLEKELNEKEELMLSQSKNAAMGEMISMIAHQWRQPITAISMNANNIMISIELDMFEKDEIKEIATKITEQTQFLSKTIDDFRNFFKKDKEIDEVNLKQLIDELLIIIGASLKNNAINFMLICEKDFYIKTYKRELLQVLLNLVKNAKEAFLEDGKKDRYIKVEIKRENEDYLIFVSDNAGGIKEENLDKIFNAYFTTKEEYNGTGLGLYMSKMIVEKHLKGHIFVDNNKEGAVFSLRLKNL